MHHEIYENIRVENVGLVMELIEKCQDCAIKLGTMIESRMGEKVPTIECLEEYCELLFQLYRDLSNGKKNDVICEVLNDRLLHIFQSVETYVDVQIEAVFLPFRASTWNALESVWQAAKEDPDCRAYVIPIPYYDKNPDGVLGGMHFEVESFPQNVTLTSYECYDFAGRRPDMIFIQNPFDDQHYTISVPHFFYSDNLKQFTENLIYIPWFVIDEIDAEDELGMQSAQEFVISPGVRNADQVILQSEQMRRIYIELLTRSEGEHTRIRWEEKILGIGSPLHDLAPAIQKEKGSIVKEWEQLLYKSDGSRKKIILYGTSISMLLQYREQMLKKLESVLGNFYKIRDEVLLIWKPEDAAWIERMVSIPDRELTRAYQGIVEKYLSEGWGIYDKEHDLERVVLAVDAFYGDSCRAIQLSRNAGIPVMLQDINLL